MSLTDLISEKALGLGISGFFAVLILKMVFAFLEKRRTPYEKILDEIKNKIDELHRWHDIDDQDGVKVWYVKRSFETTLIELTKAVEDLVRELKAKGIN